MCRLAIEIRYSVANLVQNQADDEVDSIEMRFRSMSAVKNYKRMKQYSIVACSIGAVISMVVAVWLTIVLYQIDNRDTYDFN